VSPQQQQPPPEQQQQPPVIAVFYKSLPKPAPAPAAQDSGSQRSSLQGELSSSGANLLRELNGAATFRIPNPDEDGGDSSSSS